MVNCFILCLKPTQIATLEECLSRHINNNQEYNTLGVLIFVGANLLEICVAIFAKLIRLKQRITLQTFKGKVSALKIIIFRQRSE